VRVRVNFDNFNDNDFVQSENREQRCQLRCAKGCGVVSKPSIFEPVGQVNGETVVTEDFNSAEFGVTETDYVLKQASFFLISKPKLTCSGFL